MRTEPCRSPAALHALLAALEPRTTPLLGAVLARGLGAQTARATLVRRPEASGTTCGVLVQHRWMPGGWTAHPLVLDPEAAPVIGALIDRSGATDVMGFVSDTEAVRPHVTRWRQGSTVTAASVPPGFDWPEPPSHTRGAEPRDLAALTQLAWEHAPHSLPTRWMLRRRLHEALADDLVVAETPDGGLAGYAARESHTPEYDFWSQLVIDPRHRGKGLAWQLAAAAASRTRARGAGALALFLPSNPMTVPGEAVIDDRFEFAWLASPRRFRGEPRLRALFSPG